ncbi:MAG: hypothetical protein ACK55Z_12005, partial [bacterium]
MLSPDACCAALFPCHADCTSFDLGLVAARSAVPAALAPPAAHWSTVFLFTGRLSIVQCFLYVSGTKLANS